MTASDSPKFVPAVENAIKLLRSMAMISSPEGVAPLARVSGLSVSSTFNLLKTLTKEGVVSFDPKDKTYRIGMGVLEFVAPILGANPTDLIRPLLSDLAKDHNVMVALWHVTERQRIVMIDSMAPTYIVHARMRTGSRLPALIGALGRCYAARTGMERATAEDHYAELRWQAPPGFDNYWRDIEEARKTGYAFDFGNLFIGVNIAASIACDGNSQPRLGLSAITIAGQMQPDLMTHVAIGLKEAAHQIEKNIFCAHKPSVNTRLTGLY
ncbi:IclR family transcriptional regulator [Pseudooceanicola sp.]|uniref:IclR family transcriptional regulator n=1 Tax=Pseudooceanicola sp. TaxID=1914328 RepID=UPI0040580E6F